TEELKEALPLRSSAGAEFFGQFAPSIAAPVALHRLPAVPPPVLAVPPAQRVDPLSGRLNLAVRIVEQDALDFPRIAFRRPPVVAGENAKIDNRVAGDAAGVVDIRIEIAQRQRTRRREDRLATVESRVSRPGDRAPSAAVPVQEDDMIEFVDR